MRERMTDTDVWWGATEKKRTGRTGEEKRGKGRIMKVSEKERELWSQTDTICLLQQDIHVSYMTMPWGKGRVTK